MESRFKIDIVVENGCPHYSIFDCINNKCVSCDMNELNSTLYELIEV